MGKVVSVPSKRQKVFLMTKVAARDAAGAQKQLEDSLRLPTRHRQGSNPSDHRSEQPPTQVPLGQQQPVISRMFHQPSAPSFSVTR